MAEDEQTPMPASDPPPPGDESLAPSSPPAGSGDRPDLPSALPHTVAWEFRCVPMGWEENRLLVGMVQPGHQAKDEAALQAAVGIPIKVVPLPEDSFERLFAAVYPSSIFVSPQLRTVAPWRPTWWTRLSGFWRDLPTYDSTEWILLLVAAAFFIILLVVFGQMVGVGLLVAGRILVGAMLVLLRIVLLPPVLGVLLLIGAGIILWRIGERSRRQ